MTAYYVNRRSSGFYEKSGRCSGILLNLADI